MRQYRPAVVLLLSAAVFAGCGGTETSAPSGPSASTSAASRIQPAAASGALHVTGAEVGIGDATVGSADGIRVLPHTSVPPSDQYREGVGAGASCENADIMPSDENLDRVVDATLCLLNGERADHGLGPLSQDDELASAAKSHSQDMIREQFFDHVAPDGSTPVDRIRRAGYIPSSGSWIIGENLAWGTGTLSSPKGVVKAWMNSEGHRANILRSSFDQIGFGVYAGNPRSKDGEGATYTTTFGGKSGSAADAAPAKTKKAKGKKKARKARAAKARKAWARIALQ